MDSRNWLKNLIFFSLITVFQVVNVKAMDTPTITIVNDSTNQYGQYTITSRLRDWMFGAIQMEANKDTFNVSFGSETFLPATIDPSYITVNGVACTGVLVSGQTVGIQTPIELRNFFGGEQNFTIVISAAAKVRNPSTPGTIYDLDVTAVANSGWNDDSATSDTYSIYQSNTTVTSP